MNLKKLSVFLQENEDITVLGFGWSCYWRVLVAIYGVLFLLAIILIILGA